MVLFPHQSGVTISCKYNRPGQNSRYKIVLSMRRRAHDLRAKHLECPQTHKDSQLEDQMQGHCSCKARFLRFLRPNWEGGSDEGEVIPKNGAVGVVVYSGLYFFGLMPVTHGVGMCDPLGDHTMMRELGMRRSLSNWALLMARNPLGFCIQHRQTSLRPHRRKYI
jgi:hypothetical protein